MTLVPRLIYGLDDEGDIVGAISQPGISVLEATPEQLLFSTKLDGLVLLESGNLYVPDTGVATVNLDVGGRALVTYQQNIQYTTMSPQNRFPCFLWASSVGAMRIRVRALDDQLLFDRVTHITGAVAWVWYQVWSMEV